MFLSQAGGNTMNANQKTRLVTAGGERSKEKTNSTSNGELRVQLQVNNPMYFWQRTIKGPPAGKDRTDWEQAYLDDDPYNDDEIDNQSYLYFGGEDHIDIYLDDDEVFSSSDFSELPLTKAVRCKTLPGIPKSGNVNLWWDYGMEGGWSYTWRGVSEFDPKKLTLMVGKNDHDGEFIQSIRYDGRDPDETEDQLDYRTEYSPVHFIYPKKSKPKLEKRKLVKIKKKSETLQ
jgi:hypothetical protein